MLAPASRKPTHLADRRNAVVEVGLLTGGIDKPYAFGLSMELVSKGVSVDFIGSDEVDSPELHASPLLRFLNLRGDQSREAAFTTKARRVLLYYARLMRYAASAKPKLFHILWNNRFQAFDRTALMGYYKMLGKKLVLTAHNVNAARRDGTDSLFNRLTLRAQYQLADHIFVHTEAMKSELVGDFGVSPHAVTVIPFGINNSVPNTALSPAQAKRRLGIGAGERTILFFGRIGPYKGLEYLVKSFQRLSAQDARYRLIIAGQVKAGAEAYLKDIQEAIYSDPSRERVIRKFEYIPDEDTEIYFKAADLLALPYLEVFQSGVLFLGYSFGLPVVAAAVGPFRDDIVDGRTGFLFEPGDSAGLVRGIERYFESDIFRELDARRAWIRERARARHSWNAIGDIIVARYGALLT